MRRAALHQVGEERLSRHEIAKRAGITPSGVTLRLRRGLHGLALVRPPEPSPRHQVGDERLTVKEIAAREGVTPAGIRYRLQVKTTGRKRQGRAPGVRLPRPGRGSPMPDEPLWEKEVGDAAEAVAATWRKADGSISKSGRLRRTLTMHSHALIRLFARGARVTRFGKVLCDLGVTLDSGRPLSASAVLNIWVRVERALIQRMATQKDQAA